MGTGNLYKGTNVVVDKQYADVGDSWVYDKNDGKYKVVKLDTLNLAYFAIKLRYRWHSVF